MSTRSILALQKGNRVRYCFLHWDGDNHGQTLKEMLDSEIEDLFNKMAPLDDGKYLYLDHLYPQSYWEPYIASQWADWQKCYPKGDHDRKGFEHIQMNPQPTAYSPVHRDTASLDPTECGSFTTRRKGEPKTFKEVLNGTYPFVCCEYVWFYNLDTRKITWFTDHNKQDWKPKTMNRRKRLTPKKFEF